MNIHLFDGKAHESLKPLTLTKPVGELRIGILTIAEKWSKMVGSAVSHVTPEYLQKKFPLSDEGGWFVFGGLIPTAEIVDAIKQLNEGEVLTGGGEVLAVRSEEPLKETPSTEGLKEIKFEGELLLVRLPWDIFRLNGRAIELDWELMELSNTVKGANHGAILEGDQVYIEEGAEVRHAILNSEEGPIYIGKNAKILEGSVIRGPFALCDHAVVKMAAKIYGPTTVGPHCKVGGELNNCVMQAFSNKGHDGFMGNSVIGAWCNLGADTNTSNLKNNYGEVKAYSYAHKEMRATGLQFCGVIMGDHSKTGINTMLNTGTVVGVCANIFGDGFPPKYIPSFSWGGADGFDRFILDKAFEVAERMMERREVLLTQEDKDILEYIRKETEE